MTSTIPVLAALPATGSGAATAAPPAPSGARLGAVVEALAGVSPVLVTVYLVARLLIPAILIVYTTRDASAKQRIALLRAYLLHATNHPGTNHYGRGGGR